MPTTAIAVQSMPSPWSQTGTALTMTAADVANGNHFVLTNTTIVTAQNTGGSAYTVTIDSIADAKYGRSGSVTAQSLAAGEIRSFRIVADGWANTSTGYVTLSASNAAVKFGLMVL